MNKRFFSVLLAVMLVFSIASILPASAADYSGQYSQNLIKNGSFENGPSGFYYNTYPDWSITGGQLEVWTLPFNSYYLTRYTFFPNAADGYKCAELNSKLRAPATIYQDFSSAPGTDLTVKFAASARYECPSDFSVFMGKPGYESSVYRVNCTTIGTWKYFTFTYKVPANQYTTRIKFVSNTGNSYSGGNIIDDISVVGCDTRIPEEPEIGVVTGNATNITQNSANIVSNTFSGSSISEAGIMFSLNSNMSNYMRAIGTVSSPYAVPLSGLQPNTTYYYQAYIDTSSGIYKGSIKSFTTQQCVNNPVVITGSPTNVRENTATIVNSSYNYINQANEVGIMYSLSPYMSNYLMASTYVTTPYNVDLYGLLPNTTYYYQAYVNSSTGQFKGEVKSFTTAACPVVNPTVTTGDVSNITQNTAVVYNNTFSDVKQANEAGIMYSTNYNMSNYQMARGSVTSPFTVNLSSLSPSTTYYYQAYVSSPYGTYKGQVKSFTTAKCEYNPTVTTGNAVNIGENSALISNNTYTGAIGITEAGIDISTNSNFTGNSWFAVSPSNPFNVNVYNLQPNTTYYYRAYIKEARGIFVGNVKCFTTAKKVCVPKTIANIDFENCSISPFVKWGYVSGGVVSGKGINNSRALNLCGSTGGIEYVITAEPYTTYTLTGSAKMSCGTSNLGIKNTHENYVTFTPSSSYQQKSVTYTTGAQRTTLIFYWYLPSGCSNNGYLDNVTITSVCNS